MRAGWPGTTRWSAAQAKQWNGSPCTRGAPPDQCGGAAPACPRHAADLELHWYPARRLRDGAKVMVPAPLVDWPCDPRESAYFDPGPSGAASGLGWEMALRAALLEVVERDAVMVAWQRGLRAYRVADPAALAAPGGDGERSRRALGELWQRARREGMTPFLVVLPTAHPAVWCCVGGLDDADGDLAAIGCKASDRPWEAALFQSRRAASLVSPDLKEARILAFSDCSCVRSPVRSLLPFFTESSQILVWHNHCFRLKYSKFSRLVMQFIR